MTTDRRMYRQKDMGKLKVAFHNFAKAPNKMNRCLTLEVTEILHELLVEGKRK